MPELNSTPSGERLHIALLGCGNAGKSSLINALTEQDLAIVSPQKGTTTDPVQKAMELPPLGPVVFIDTPGLNDKGELGNKRIERTYRVLNKADIALLIVDAVKGLTKDDEEIMTKIHAKNLPCLVIFNKIDLITNFHLPHLIRDFRTIGISAKTGTNINILKTTLGQLQPKPITKVLVSDLLHKGEVVILVTPIDAGAPKGRIILPQQQVLRDLLEHGILTLVIQPEELYTALNKLQQPPALVITDSQVFGKVNQILPSTIPLTSFSILFARYKGNLKNTIEGAKFLKNLQDNDKVLICEGCTHHRQCGDIGTEKLPQWIRQYSHANPNFSFTSGGDFPLDLSSYKLIIHCGGCMLTEREVQYRYRCANDAHIPITNYGIAIAEMHNILDRSTEILIK